ncbi:hypothetical protein [Paenibacillus lautus]|uniref:hypothetical protein n=1 Tax=Paenibacillus lautus TaxID=1401 RepID=UPI003D9A9A62
MPTKLFSKPALTLDHSPSMMTVIRTSTIVAFAFHSITPLGKRPSLQRSQEELCHPLQAERDETAKFHEHHGSPQPVLLSYQLAIISTCTVCGNLVLNLLQGNKTYKLASRIEQPHLRDAI